MKTLIRLAVNNASARINKGTKIDKRESILIEELEKVGITNFQSVGEKPATGCAFSVIEIKSKYRVNYRCGYGRNNYAPCIEISK